VAEGVRKGTLANVSGREGENSIIILDNSTGNCGTRRIRKKGEESGGERGLTYMRNEHQGEKSSRKLILAGSSSLK